MIYIIAYDIADNKRRLRRQTLESCGGAKTNQDSQL